MKLTVFHKLQKAMALTFSDSDGEALNAIRAANRILTEEGIDWDKVFKKLVTLDIEAATPDDDPAQRAADRRQGIQQMFDTVLASDLKGGFLDFINSLKEQWDSGHTLSTAQVAALRSAADRVDGQRQPGFRRR